MEISSLKELIEYNKLLMRVHHIDEFPSEDSDEINRMIEEVNEIYIYIRDEGMMKMSKKSGKFKERYRETILIAWKRQHSKYKPTGY